MSQTNFKAILSGRAGLPIYFIVAAALFAICYGVYQGMIDGTDHYYRYLELCAAVSSNILSLMGFENKYYEYNTAITRILGDFDVYTDVGKGSGGLMIIAVLASVILAWPGSWLKKLLVLIIGIVLMFFLNCLRIALTLLVDIYYPLNYELLAGYVLPLSLIACALVYFVIWTMISGQHPDDVME